MTSLATSTMIVERKIIKDLFSQILKFVRTRFLNVKY